MLNWSSASRGIFGTVAGVNGVGVSFVRWLLSSMRCLTSLKLSLCLDKVMVARGSLPLTTEYRVQHDRI